MKIRTGFVSNSSSSAFILNVYSRFDWGRLPHLAMAFEEVKVLDNNNILVKYTGGVNLATKILTGLNISGYITWTNVE